MPRVSRFSSQQPTRTTATVDDVMRLGVMLTMLCYSSDKKVSISFGETVFKDLKESRRTVSHGVLIFFLNSETRTRILIL